MNNISSVGSRPTCRIGKAIVESNSALISPNVTGYNKTSPKKDSEPMGHVMSLRYNPITNPIPLVTQNPYVYKEITSLSQRSNGNI